MVYELSPPINENGTYDLKEDGTFGPDKPSWVYMADDTLSFHSGYISGAHRLKNGNTFVTQGAAGRFFEINKEGDILWEYYNPYRGPIKLPNGKDTGRFPKDYLTFRATYISPDHPGLQALDLTPVAPQPETFENPLPDPKEEEEESS